MADYTSTFKPATSEAAGKNATAVNVDNTKIFSPYYSGQTQQNNNTTKVNTAKQNTTYSIPTFNSANNANVAQTSYATQAANNQGWTNPTILDSSGNAIGNNYDWLLGMPNMATQQTTPSTTTNPAVTSKAVTDYLNSYNADREAKIQNMYSGNLASQNAGLKTALDTNLGTLKSAYDANLGNLKTAYDNNTGSLKTAYDKNLAQLGNAYQQNLSDAQYAMSQISPQYQQSMNALGADYERQRRNNNMQAAVNGLNTGTGSQMALGQSTGYQRNLSNLARSENEALNEATRGILNLNRDYTNQQNILNTEFNNNVDRLNREYQNNLATYGTTYQNNVANMKTNYENQIAQAAANNDYQLAAALLDEYGSQYDRMQQQASLLAQFGDFSAYADLYGKDAAEQMRLTWALQNPEVAWASGNLKAEDYYALTGKMPSNPNTMYDLYNYGSPMYGSNGAFANGQNTGYYTGVSQQTNPANDLYSMYNNYYGGY